MNDDLKSILAELEAFGVQNDASQPERSHKMLNITRETGEFLAVLVAATQARMILEIGTSNGYSTLWLAHAASGIGGAVTTLEMDELKFNAAQQNFARANLSAHIDSHLANASELLPQSDANVFDMIFLDSDRAQYMGWWADLRRILKVGGLLVVDNATSHAAEMCEWMDVVRQDVDFRTSLVEVGNGQFMAVRLA